MFRFKKIRLNNFRPRALSRRFKHADRKTLIAAGFATVVIALTALGVVQNFMSTKIDPAAYEQLLDTIAKGESKGNYNAYYGNAGNTTIRFTEMSVADVLKWQETYVNDGSISSAVGKYQIIRPTLLGLVKELQIDTSLRFDEALQDRMAIALLERRGAQAFVEKKMTREQFAASLAKEWAALPKVIGDNPAQSYYAGDGINKALIGVDEVFRALTPLEQRR